MIRAGKRIALISDIHSNYIALEVLYEELKKEFVHGIIFLGDYLTDCPYPMKTIEILDAMQREYDCYFIRGNREDYLLDYYFNKPDWSSPSGRGSIKYTYDNINEDILKWFNNMPLTLDGIEALYCHGSPGSNIELLHFHKPETPEWLKEVKNNIVCGHTHVQGIFKAHGYSIINPGSVGVALGEGKSGNYAILEINGVDITADFKSFKYDYKKLYDIFLETNLFEIGGYFTRAIYRNIVTGKPVTMYLLKAAFSLARADGYETEIIPEIYWEKAAEKYGLIGDLND